ncbi:hypothetical protein E2C01_067115 [Portunus trituberculatus]|uniref:Uncharacterized protein n=1 Tax=Portunus trituberculatus TaxID=210409 RepID=A0A5B7HNA3_PORTR|nr:hypothetical protein [Portunus trituberculatus]
MAGVQGSRRSYRQMFTTESWGVGTVSLLPHRPSRLSFSVPTRPPKSPGEMRKGSSTAVLTKHHRLEGPHRLQPLSSMAFPLRHKMVTSSPQSR